MYRWAAEIVYLLISPMTKWIVGLWLLRICPHQRWRQVTIWSLLGVVTLFELFYIGVAVVACQPIDYQWLRYAPVKPIGQCNASTFATVTAYIAGCLNVIGDWVLPLMPASLVWKSTGMTPRTKASVIALLALGSIASIATIVRIPYARGILNQPDYLYNFTDLGIWSTVEIGVALTASSLATLKPLFKKMGIFSDADDEPVSPLARSGTIGSDRTRRSQKPIDSADVDIEGDLSCEPVKEWEALPP
jgi:hypothetical protein